MTSLTADQPVARPPRPATVTVAFWLQLAAVLLLLGLIGVAVAYAVFYDGRISRAVELVPGADPDEVGGERTGNVVTAAVSGGLALVMLVWLAVTAAPVRRGGNVARIFVFIAAGAHLLLCAAPCIGGLAVAPLFMAGSGPEFEPEFGPDGLPLDTVPWEESRFLDVLYSSTTPAEDAFFAGQSVFMVLEVLVVLAVVVLLAVPPATRFFVPRAAPVWPPLIVTPYGGYTAALPYVICPDPSVHVPPPAPPRQPDGP